MAQKIRHQRLARNSTTFSAPIRGIALACAFALVGVAVLIGTRAATPTLSIEPESGVLSPNASNVSSTGVASGGYYVLFKGATAPTYCGGRTFTGKAKCIGAAEWALSTCSTTAACQAATHPCLAYMNGDLTKIYDMSTFTGHSGGADAVINPAICGKDIYSIITRATPDYDQGTVLNNSKHAAVANRTQSTFNSLLTGSEYDPNKP